MNDSHITKTYNIGKLFYVAFFGGTIALTVLGLRNSRWLQVKPVIQKLLLLAAIVIFAIKIGFYYAYIHHAIEIDKRSIRYILRAGELLLFGGFYLAMKDQFKKHLALGGVITPMKKSGIAWSIGSMVIELGLITLLVFI